VEPVAPLDRPPLSPEPRERPDLHRRGRQAAALALLVGVLLRLAQYAVNRSLWLDEALLASNFLDRGWAALFAPFHRGQTAPLGFLALEKLAVALLGRGELALRLFPLLAGLAALALLPRVARRYLTRGALPLGIALVALAPFLVYYSSEVKPYAGDALCSLAVLWLAHDLARRPRSGRLAAAFGAFGTVALWFSQPAAFMLAGTGLVLGARALRRRDRRALALLAPAAAAWTASLAGAYLYARHQLLDPEYMRAFWREGFFPLPPRGLDQWLWLPRALAHAFREPMGIVGTDESPLSRVGTAAGVALFLAGCAWMARHRRLRLALLLAPLGLTLAASAARVYPFGGEFLAGGRVLIFLMPSLAFVAAEGAAALRRWLPRPAGKAAFALGAALALVPAVAYATLSVPHLRSEVKPLLRYANEHRLPGDLMYVYYNGQSIFEYYAPRYGWDRSNAVAGVCSRFDPPGYARDLARLRGRRRVWVLIVSGASVRGFQEDRVIVDFLDHFGTRLDDAAAVGARLYLFDLGAPRPGGHYTIAVPPFVRDPAMDCRGAWEPLNLLH
jgi:hypothetical protein